MKELYFEYAVVLTKEREGGYSVSFPDLPEAITQGDTIEHSLHEASDCLEEAIANRIIMKLDLPVPSKPKSKQKTVTLHAILAAKAALYKTMRAKKLSNVALAKLLGCHEKKIRRLLDPNYTSKLPFIEHALEVLGHRLNISLRPSNTKPRKFNKTVYAYNTSLN